MKIDVKIVVLLFGIASLLNPALSSAQLYFGAKVGPTLVKFDDIETNKDPTNMGVTLGYEFSSLVSGLALELEATRSIAPGEVAEADLEVESQGIYVAYRTNGQLYFKARLGVMEAALSGTLAEDEGGETYGIGVGWQLSSFSLELEYTSIDDDVGYASVGALYRF